MSPHRKGRAELLVATWAREMACFLMLVQNVNVIEFFVTVIAKWLKYN
jgi:hypothetical protein